MRLALHDEKTHPYQNGGLVSLSPSGEASEFWDGADGYMPSLDQQERLAACWNACSGVPTRDLSYEKLDKTRAVLRHLLDGVERLYDDNKLDDKLDDTILKYAVGIARSILGKGGMAVAPAPLSAPAPPQSEAGPPLADED